MAKVERTRRNKVLGTRERKTVTNAAAILQELTERYINTNTELLEAYEAVDSMRVPELMDEEAKKLETELAKMETEILETVAAVYSAVLGLTPQEVVRKLRRRAYAIASSRLTQPDWRNELLAAKEKEAKKKAA